MRVVFIGCVNFSKAMLEYALEIECLEIVGIVTKSESNFNTDFCSLAPLAQEHNISYLLYDQLKSESGLNSWVELKFPDVIFCFGWSHLLKAELIEIPKIGVIGHHPTMLPKNRGRHPVIWALALGLEYTASTFFFIDPGVDSGDILDQIPVNINFDDDASILYQKITVTAGKQLKTFSPLLEKGEYIVVKQDMSKATWWRKRSKADGYIDWRMSCFSIHNLVRALTCPYVGAHCEFNNRDIKIWKVRIMYKGLDDIEPGKIIDLNRNKNEIYIKCGDGVMCIYDHEFDPLPEIGTYL